MLSVAEVLKQLQDQLTAEAAAESIRRLVRVPEAWDSLRDEERLAALLNDSPERLGLSQIVDQVLTELGAASSEVELADSAGPSVEALLSAESQAVSDERDIKAVSLLANHLRGAVTEDLDAWVPRFAAWPQFWRSPLACAWPSLPNSGALLAGLLAHPDARVYPLITTCLLANGTTQQAASQLEAAAGVLPVAFLDYLEQSGEEQLARAASPGQHTAGDAEPNAGAVPTIERLLARSRLLSLQGDPEAAQASLDEAWDLAARQRAAVADQIGDIAQSAGQSVLAAQAFAEALTAETTPERRAKMARALLESGRADEALAALEPDPESFVECIALGMTYREMGENQTAESMLLKAADTLDMPPAIPADWLQILADAMAQMDRLTQAVKAVEKLLELRPAGWAERAQLADLYQQLGDSEAALGAASLALAMAPDNPKPRQTLAKSLQALGRPSEALEHWRALAREDGALRSQVIDCALESGQDELAVQMAEALFEDDPESPTSLTLFGRALAASDQHRAARSFLLKAVKLAPEAAEAWIALAEAQAQAGEPEVAGETLASAVQACPGSPEIHLTHARWLRQQGKTSDALKAAKSASRLAPQDIDALLEHGELLMELGHWQEAIPILQSAQDRRPSSLRTRTTLAQAYELAGDFSRGHQLLDGVQLAESGKAHFLAGRLAVQAEGDAGALAQSAMDHLDKAKGLGIDDPSLDLWLARALSQAGQHEDALRAYQACLRALPQDARKLRIECICGEAQAAMLGGQLPVAISVLERARETEPPSAHVLDLLTQAYLKAGLPEEALQPALKAAEMEPDEPGHRARFLEAAKASQAWDLALERVDAWMAQNGADGQIWLEKAHLHHQLGQSEHARTAVARALACDRQSRQTLLDASRLLQAMNLEQDCLHVLRHAGYRYPEDADILRHLAQASERAGDLEGAADIWARLARMQPQDTEALSGTGKALWAVHRRASAIGYWQRALALQPDNPDLHATLAGAQLANGEIGPGLDHYRQAAQLRESDSKLHLEAGKAHLAHGSLVEAEALLRSAVQLQPTGPQARQALAECLIQMQRSGDAHNVLLSAPSRDHTAGTLALLALCELEAGDGTAAEQALARAGETAPETPDDLVRLVKAALALGDWEAAAEAFERSPWRMDENDQLATAFLAARARTAEAAWLFTQGAAVLRRAPQASLASDEAMQEASRLLESLAPAALNASDRAALAIRLQAAFQPELVAPQDMRALLPEAADPLAMAETVEAVALYHLRLGEPEEAITALAAHATPPQAGSWSSLLAGLAHMHASRHSLARKAFGATISPTLRPMAAYLSAISWAEEGQYDQAIASLNSALVSWPDEPNWQAKLAELYMRTDMPEAALPHLQEAAEAEPGNADLQLELGRVLAATGELSESASAFSKALRHHHQDPTVWREAGSVSLALGRSDEASARFEQAIALSPNNVDALIGAAQAALQRGQVRQALDYADEAARLAPNSAEALVAQAEVLAAQGKGAQALRRYDQAMAHSHRPLDVHLARGRLLLDMGHAEQAVEALTAATEKATDDQRLWSALAEAYEQLNALDSAVDCLRQAVALSPGSISHRRNLARLARKSGQLDRALAELMHLQSEAPNDADVAVELGRCHYARREPQDALRAYERAIELDPRNSQAHYHAGLILKEMKAYPRSAEMLKRAVDLNPRDTEALHQLAAVRALEFVHGPAHNTVVTP